MTVAIRPATADDAGIVAAFVAAYHAFEQIDLDDRVRRRAVDALIADESLGAIWLVTVDGECVGYIALCFGYSIEFAGRDAFVDEFFIAEAHRGRGHGARVLDLVAGAASALGVRALHLEVAKSNTRAIRLYDAAGFEARSKYQLMTRRLGDS